MLQKSVNATQDLRLAPPEGQLLNIYQVATEHYFSKTSLFPQYMPKYSKRVVFGYHSFICPMHHAKTQ